MPLVSSKYRPPKKIFRNPDVSTLYAALLRKVNGVTQTTERLELPDGDFMDLDWSYATQKTNTCVIILHGLEGHAHRPYVLGAAKIFNENSIDCCAVNYRSCSGEPNRVFSNYHSGRTEDVRAVVNHVLNKGNYDKIIINGFSLGGNLTLKFAGEKTDLPKEVKLAIAVSTPVDLEGCMHQLHRPRNFVYATDFLLTLKKKLKDKQEQFPDLISDHDIKKVKSLKAFDDFYTSKANGFLDALDYYRKSSSRQFIPEIEIPTLLINAKNDSFLSETCYPREEAEKMSNLYFEIPDYGGHVGFVDSDQIYYNEKRAIAFVKDHLA